MSFFYASIDIDISLNHHEFIYNVDFKNSHRDRFVSLGFWVSAQFSLVSQELDDFVSQQARFVSKENCQCTLDSLPWGTNFFEKNEMSHSIIIT